MSSGKSNFYYLNKMLFEQKKPSKSFSSYRDANNLLSNNSLINDGCTIFIPQRLLTIIGSIKDVGLSILEEEIQVAQS